MSTPTPSAPNAPPPSASKNPQPRAAGHVSTPRSAPSPAPRGVPSPNTMRRDYAAKTPTNHPTTSSSGSKTLGGTPMLLSSSQQALLPSSSSPAGLGLDLGMGTPGVGMATPGSMAALGVAGGVGMGLSLSEMGLGSGVARRDEGEERRGKLRGILGRIGGVKGRVGEEGIARVSRRVGFTNDVDELDAIERDDGVKRRVRGNRPIAMAGKAVVVELGMRDGVPLEASVSLGSEDVGARQAFGAAADVLLRDLKEERGNVDIAVKLDAFHANLERLATIDRLSSPGVNGFEAIAGLYSSLERLYRQELLAQDLLVESNTPLRELRLEMGVMCERSGRPRMHARGRVGLSLQYWKTRRHARNVRDGAHGDVDAMEIDATGDHAASETIEDAYGADDIFSMHIELEPSSADLYPPLRVSDAWLPEPLHLPIGLQPPWQEPPPTLSIAEGDAMAVGQAVHRQPDLRFVAHLDPPVVLPWQVAMRFLQSAGLPELQLYDTQPPYHSLVLSGISPCRAVGAGATDALATATKNVLTKCKGAHVDVQHRNSLYVPRSDFGFELKALPFSHPKQLLQMLPELRQWAFVGSILQTALTPTPEAALPAHARHGNVSTPSLSDLLHDDVGGESDCKLPLPLPVSITLATCGATALTSRSSNSLTFHFPATPSQLPPLSVVTMQVQAQGRLNVAHQNVVPPRTLCDTSNDASGPPDPLDWWRRQTDEPDEAALESAEHGLLAKLLDVFAGDVGLWIEWMRREDD